MAERDFEPKPGWNSARDDIVNDFYRPALSRCVRYDRLTGFFDSSTFAVAFREALDFMGRGGRMRLITSAKFSQADLDVITKSVDDQLLEDVSSMLNDDLGKKCLGLFAHMLTAKIGGEPQIDIRILVPRRGIFHAKVGIFNMEDGDAVSFSGSINETGMGWTGNVEEFKAFCSWTDEKFVDLDKGTFREFWGGRPRGHTLVRPAPRGAREDPQREARIRRRIPAACKGAEGDLRRQGRGSPPSLCCAATKRRQ